MKFIDFSKSLEAGIAPIYYLEGEEAYFRDQVVSKLRSACVTQPELNDIRLDGDALKGDKFVSFCDNLYVLPFLSERRLVRVYEFYPSERDFEKYLKRYFQAPSPSTLLVIVNSKKKTGAADLRKAENVTFVDCSKEKEEVLCRWLYGTAKRRGLLADQDAVQRMVRYCNYDCARMAREVEKLWFLLGEGGRLTSELVDEHITKDVEYKVYELTQAASRKSYSVFTEIMTDLLKKDYDENAVLAALTVHYRTLYEVTEIKGSDDEVAKILGIKPYAVQKNRDIASRMGRATIKEYYASLYRLSADMRCGLITKESALDAAVAKIFFGNA